MSPSISCPKCWLRSSHPKDIAERYCGKCHQFHADMGLAVFQSRALMLYAAGEFPRAIAVMSRGLIEIIGYLPEEIERALYELETPNPTSLLAWLQTAWLVNPFDRPKGVNTLSI